MTYQRSIGEQLKSYLGDITGISDVFDEWTTARKDGDMSLGDWTKIIWQGAQVPTEFGFIAPFKMAFKALDEWSEEVVEPGLAWLAMMDYQTAAEWKKRNPDRSYLEAVNAATWGASERDDPNRVTIGDVYGGSFSAPPRLEDFAELQLPEKDVADLRTCRVGDCAVKLDANTIQALLAEVDWKAPGAAATVNRALQRFALFYVNGYLEADNARLAEYRDHSRPTAVAEEFSAMVQHVPELTPSVGEMRRYLLEYPNVAPEDATSFLYWQETDFGLKPTIRISHLAVREGPDDTVVASKMLYASHYFWTGLEVRVLLPDASRGPGFWLVNFNFGRSDGLGGFTGRIVRVWVRSAAQK